jgi:mycothiol synthase
MNCLPLPQGYTCRPARLEDVPVAVDLFNAWAQKYLGADDLTIEIINREWRTPNFDLETNTRLVVDPDGRLAGYYELWDSGHPHVSVHVWGRIHPEHEGRGLGTYLLSWAESRAREIVPQAPPNTRVVLLAWVLSHLSNAGQLLLSSGFNLIRYNLRMVIELTVPPLPKLPSEIEIRSMRPGTDELATFETLQASFRDHWGYVERPQEELYKRFLHSMQDNETFDPSLWYLAWAGDRVVGTSLCQHHLTEEPNMGWVSSLGVVREWRRKGLGLALLEHSFSGLYERGQRRVGLGVDAQSLTGATKLYEKAGMKPEPKGTYAIYEKELRSGLDLTIR